MGRFIAALKIKIVRFLSALSLSFGLLFFATIARADPIRVCTRPSNIPANVERWAFTSGGMMLTDNKIVFMKEASALTIYIFDPNAPPESARLLPIPFHTLKCPARVLPPKKPVLPPQDEERKKNEARKKDEARKKNEARKKDEKVAAKERAEASKPASKPAAQPPPDEEEREPRGTIHPPEEAISGESVVEERPKSTLPFVKKSDKPVPMTGLCGACEPKKLTEEKSKLDRAAEELAFAGAIASLRMNEAPHPNGKRYGIIGGQNPNGPNNPVVQAAAGGALVTVAVLAAAGKIEKALIDAIQKKVPLVLKGTAKVSKEVAEYLAKRWGSDLTWALHRNGTIGPYSVMRNFTADQGGAYQAHHVLEQAKMRFFKLGNPELAPAVILTAAEHKAITTKLAQETVGATTKEKLWEAYQKAYMDHPEWLKAIESYFLKGK